MLKDETFDHLKFNYHKILLYKSFIVKLEVKLLIYKYCLTQTTLFIATVPF